ncbi:MAG: N-acetylmuramoyl-L-alanine amidase [Oscillospiraceae bacterium]|nr:N-acetylmuramoyl-L-alanine amidase [Oscillospiraceae bacterium]
MPSVFLSPSTQEFNQYVSGGSEEYYMNLLADRMEPYLRSSGIKYVRNDPDRQFAGAIKDSNAGSYDVHLALHTNAAPDNLKGQLRGIDVYYAPKSQSSQRLATIIANNLESIYPLPEKSVARPTSTLGEVLNTKAVAVLAEIGYHDNPQDEQWIKGNLNQIAANLVESLADYFGIPFIEAGPVMRGIVVTNPGSRVNIRKYPSTSSEILGTAPDGAEVQIYGKYNDWYVIGYGDITGYAYSQYVVMA